jgi:hypothetical protein
MIIEAPSVPVEPGRHGLGAHRLGYVAEVTPVQLKKHYAEIRQKVVLIQVRGVDYSKPPLDRAASAKSRRRSNFSAYVRFIRIR